MGIVVLVSYFVALAIALFAGVIQSFTGFLVFLLVTVIGVVVFAGLGKITRG
ncbi:MAG TPA: hypothetical protein VKZ63_08890 [Kofleriaceae bacterium]|nr:hypothetical protein [Kofleriaceae bacterium]